MPLKHQTAMRIVFTALRKRKIFTYMNNETRYPTTTLALVAKKSKWKSYAFVTYYDLKDLARTGSCYISFGDTLGRDNRTLAVAKVLIEELEKHGFTTEWNGSRWKRVKASITEENDPFYKEQSKKKPKPIDKDVALRISLFLIRRVNLLTRSTFRRGLDGMEKLLEKYPNKVGFLFYDYNAAYAWKTKGKCKLYVSGRDQKHFSRIFLEINVLSTLRKFGLTARWKPKEPFTIYLYKEKKEADTDEKTSITKSV